MSEEFGGKKMSEELGGGKMSEELSMTDERTFAEREFPVEKGRVRMIEEIQQKLDLLLPISEAERLAFDEVSCMEIGPRKDEALRKYDEKYPDGADILIAIDGLKEILEDLNPLKGLRPVIDMIPDPVKREKGILMLKEGIKAVAEAHVRNARGWIEMFGMDSFIRIDVFSWICGVEPCFDPLEDPTEEEEEMFAQQAKEMAERIKEALQTDVKEDLS